MRLEGDSSGGSGSDSQGPQGIDEAELAEF